MLATVGVLLGGCDLSTNLPRDSSASLQTDAIAYELRASGNGWAVDIPYIFTNQTGAPIYVVNCNGGFGLRLERLRGSEWKAAWGPVTSACLSPPIIIESGGTFSDTIYVRGSVPGTNWYPQFDVANPTGLYRIVWTDALSSFDPYSDPFGSEIALDSRVSNRFFLSTR